MPIRENNDPKIKGLKGLHLYGGLDSPNVSPIAYWAIDNNIPFTFHKIDGMKFEQFGDEYTAINPTHEVPAIVDDGVVVTDSVDILKYLEEKYQTPGSKLYDSTDDDSKILLSEGLDQMLHAVYVFHGPFKPLLGMFEGNYKKRLKLGHQSSTTEFMSKLYSKTDGFTDEQFRQGVREAVAHCEKLDDILSKQDYLLGDVPSIADYYWAPKYKGHIPFISDYPALNAWCNKMHESEELQKTLAPPFMMKVMMFMLAGKFKAANKDVQKVVESVRAENKAKKDSATQQKAA